MFVTGAIVADSWSLDGFFGDREIHVNGPTFIRWAGQYGQLKSV